MMNQAELAPDAMKSIRNLMGSGQFERALEILDAELGAQPQNHEAQYMAAVCSRYLGRYDDARERLDALIEASPEFGRAHQELGHLLLTQGDESLALSAFTNACRFNPGLEVSWRKQAELLAKAGMHQAANAAYGQAQRLATLPKELVSVTNLVAEGKLLKAENLCRRFLKVNPRNVEGMRLLADIGEQLNVLEDAEVLLEHAVSFEPDNVQLRLDYIQVLRKRQKYEGALKEARHLYDKDPENPVFQSNLAIIQMQAGDFENAIALFDRVLETLPNDPATLTSKGHALKTWGKHTAAVTSYKSACENRPEQGDAWYALANLKTYKFDEEEIERMQAKEADPLISHSDRFHFCFALGKAFEDRGQYDRSFHYYDKGNALKRAMSRYTTQGMLDEFEAQKSACTGELFQSKMGLGCKAADPIFIVGLPRAGSTLIEQILASHSQVDGTLELPNILSIAQQLRGRNRSEGGAYPANLLDLQGDQLAELGQEYIDTTRIHRQGAPFFTDKMPNNFRHIGLIHLILPNAKVIDARRAAMDCCFSGFKQLFAEGQEFTYGLEEVGGYYQAYVDLMDHWDNVLPGKVLRVQHEDVIEDLEGQVKRILDYCNLPFETACVDFHKNDRAVRTASSEQVRQPINRKGLDVWRHFEAHLAPLKKALGDNLAP